MLLVGLLFFLELYFSFNDDKYLYNLKVNNINILCLFLEIYRNLLCFFFKNIFVSVCVLWNIKSLDSLLYYINL